MVVIWLKKHYLLIFYYYCFNFCFFSWSYHTTVCGKSLNRMFLAVIWSSFHGLDGLPVAVPEVSKH